MKRTLLSALAYLTASTVLGISAWAAPVFQMRLADEAPSGNSERMSYVTHYDQHTVTNVYYVQKTVLLDETALKSATPGKDALGHGIIDITFTDAGAKRFAEVTRQNLHKRLAIIIDGQILEAPMVQSEILGGKAQISGSFSKGETRDLARKINEAVKRK